MTLVCPFAAENDLFYSRLVFNVAFHCPLIAENDLFYSRLVPPGRLEGASRAAPGRLQGASRAPPGRLQGASRAPPGRLQATSRAPPGRLQGVSRAPPTPFGPPCDPLFEVISLKTAENDLLHSQFRVQAELCPELSRWRGRV